MTDLSRRIQAKSPHTSTSFLTTLSNDNSNWVRECVAENPNTSKETLTILVNDKDNQVRLAAKQRLEHFT